MLAIYNFCVILFVESLFPTKKMKRILTALLALTLLCSLSLPTFAAQTVAVKVDGKKVAWTDATPFIDENKRTLVPLRAVAEAMGMEVSWDEDTETATFEKTTTFATYELYTEVDFVVGDTTVYVYHARLFPSDWYMDTSYTVDMDTAPVLVGSRTYAPLRYLADSFDYAVSWDQRTFTASADLVEAVLYSEHHTSENKDAPLFVGLYPGSDFDSFYGLKVANVKVNGKTADFHVFTKDELASLNANYGTDFYSVAFTLKGNYEYGEYAVTWDSYFYNKDGSLSTTPESESFTWVYAASTATP